jgi:hypothetical protein
MIVYFSCSTNNKVVTVFDNFIQAVTEFGLPSRVRSDKGDENVDVAWCMLAHPYRGANRGSHIRGRSVHNPQIDRMWKDLFAGGIHLFCSCSTSWRNVVTKDKPELGFIQNWSQSKAY